MATFGNSELTYLDCFGQRFLAPGQVRYAITRPFAADHALGGGAFVLDISEKGAKPQQRHVEVVHDHNRFLATPRRLAINVGDVVVWHAPRHDTPPYVVWGEGEAGPFSSRAMRGDAFYSHAFLEPADIAWSGGGERGAGGRIRVRLYDADQDGDAEAWRQRLRQGVVIVVEDGRASPAEVEAVVGQTVFVGVSGADGFTITVADEGTPG